METEVFYAASSCFDNVNFLLIASTPYWIWNKTIKACDMWTVQVPGINLSGDSSWKLLEDFNSKIHKQLIHRVVNLLL